MGSSNIASGIARAASSSTALLPCRSSRCAPGVGLRATALQSAASRSWLYLALIAESLGTLRQAVRRRLSTSGSSDGQLSKSGGLLARRLSKSGNRGERSGLRLPSRGQRRGTRMFAVSHLQVVRLHQLLRRWLIYPRALSVGLRGLSPKRSDLQTSVRTVVSLAGGSLRSDDGLVLSRLFHVQCTEIRSDKH